MNRCFRQSVETEFPGRVGGDGMLGFAQAYLLAGSRSVCLSLWKVDDTATTLLMDRFYRNLLGKRQDGANPMCKAVALNEAQVWLENLTFLGQRKLVDFACTQVSGVLALDRAD